MRSENTMPHGPTGQWEEQAIFAEHVFVGFASRLCIPEHTWRCRQAGVDRPSTLQLDAVASLLTQTGLADMARR